MRAYSLEKRRVYKQYLAAVENNKLDNYKFGSIDPRKHALHKIPESYTFPFEFATVNVIESNHG